MIDRGGSKLPVESENMFLKNKIALYFLVCSFSVHAEIDYDTWIEDEEEYNGFASYKEGGFYFKPDLKLKYDYDSNVFDTEGDQESSERWVVQPGISSEWNTGRTQFEIDLKSKLVDYVGDSPFEDFSDYYFKLGFDQQWNSRHRTYLYGVRSNVHDDSRESLIRSISNDGGLTEYQEDTIALIYRLGQPDSKGTLGTEIYTSDRDYEQPQISFNQIDRSISGISSLFVWNAFSRTSLLLETRYKDIDYIPVDGLISLNSYEVDVLTGVRWGISNFTRAEIKIGYGLKDFDEEDREDSTNPSWELKLFWEPLERAVVDLTFLRYEKEIDLNVGNFIDVRELGAGWNHQWLSRFRTRTSLLIIDENYIGQDYSEDEKRVSLDSYYNFYRDLEFKLSLNWSSKIREANAETTSDFDRFWVKAGVNF